MSLSKFIKDKELRFLAFLGITLAAPLTLLYILVEIARFGELTVAEPRPMVLFLEIAILFLICTGLIYLIAIRLRNARNLARKLAVEENASYEAD